MDARNSPREAWRASGTVATRPGTFVASAALTESAGRRI